MRASGKVRPMAAVSEQELVADLARTVINEVAPHELPLFRPVSTAYFVDPDAVVRQRPRDELLAFGTESLLALTPYVLAIATPVIGLLLDGVRKAVQEESADVVRPLVRRLIRRTPRDGEGEPQAAAALLPLTPDQLGEVRRLAVEKARQLDLPEATAKLLADAMVGSLAVPT
jgi:hypothetical protein